MPLPPLYKPLADVTTVTIVTPQTLPALHPGEAASPALRRRRGYREAEVAAGTEVELHRICRRGDGEEAESAGCVSVWKPCQRIAILRCGSVGCTSVMGIQAGVTAACCFALHMRDVIAPSSFADSVVAAA